MKATITNMGIHDQTRSNRQDAKSAKEIDKRKTESIERVADSEACATHGTFPSMLSLAFLASWRFIFVFSP
jgi:hypothetical protein